MVINGKEYTLPELDYNAICELDKYGVNLLSGETVSPFAMLRGFVALCMRSKTAAGRELEEHIVNGGDLAELSAEIGTAIEESRFLSRMREKAQKDEEMEAKRAKAAKSLPKMKTE